MYKIYSFTQNKSMKRVLICLLIFSTLLFAGCGNKELEAAKIVRDDARTGGSLSFVYDKNQKTVFVGGEGEIVQYSTDGESEGNRVGLKIFAPNEKIDLSDASLKMNGVNYSNFLETINGQKQRFFNIYPIVSENDKEISFTITWASRTKEQKYKLVVVDGTKFMKKDGTV